MRNAYLSTRRDDIDHVIHLVQSILLNQDCQVLFNTNLRNHIIIVADDPAPADALVLQHQQIRGFLTESGGPLSHTAMLARSFQISAAVGIHDASNLLCNEQQIVLDGNHGMVLADIEGRELKA